MKAYQIRDNKTGKFVTDGISTHSCQAVIWFDLKDVRNFLNSLESQLNMSREVSQEEEFFGPPLPKTWEIVTLNVAENLSATVPVHAFLKKVKPE